MFAGALADASAMTASGADLLDMATGGKEWNAGDAILDGVGLTSAGAGVRIIAKIPEESRTLGEAVKTGIDFAVGVPSFVSGLFS